MVTLLFGTGKTKKFAQFGQSTGADDRIIIPSEYKTKTLILSDSYGRGIQARENLTVVGFPGSSFETFFSNIFAAKLNIPSKKEDLN